MSSSKRGSFENQKEYILFVLSLVMLRQREVVGEAQGEHMIQHGVSVLCVQRLEQGKAFSIYCKKLIVNHLHAVS